ncbi:MAG: cupredoxin domain-containing protein [Candidatus Zambryskibacteria bacterium]
MKNIITIILIALVLIGGVFIFTKRSPKTENGNIVSANNVTVKDGVQIIEIKAKGGYSPRTSIAKAGIPTILRFSTNGTFDCSSAMRIPSLNISRNLPISGLTDVELPTPTAGALRGSCGMGMYPFEVVFND